ncbi:MULTISPECIES: Flp family type IVb pilin [Halobacteriovorax]|uniref:Flp family type IVb pilin n=1 Tax=Halobacteriovorax vibrionivorans TaxID=2152716 RepID=A0ABY0IJU6_9BACT|nr:MULTISPECIES: hypothetical protein [Halobacteriovorax]AYF43210.1 hypothetical protein BALOs_0189 [Halobacteriovorax sp. BALOs_7]RZF23226.1 hypothetical protein DAY19_05510 [Halobacteriovorax vibrionivorans]TGD46379.1 hypothetical protein EP118_12510 [Halobacteriovorax sp. Y22]
MLRQSQSGQALIEYIFILAFFAGISIAMARGIGTYTTGFFKSFAFHLSQELSTGACPRGCWHSPFVNGNE